MQRILEAVSKWLWKWLWKEVLESRFKLEKEDKRGQAQYSTCVGPKYRYSIYFRSNVGESCYKTP